MLGASKLAAVCVLLLPAIVRLKEWAYAGFGITILSASYSHLLSGDGLLALEPLVTFAALVLSYSMRPPSRTFFHPAPGNAVSPRDATYANKQQPMVSLDKA